MASVKAFNAIFERLVEKTKAANPGVDIHKRKPKGKPRLRKGKRKPKIIGWLH